MVLAYGVKRDIRFDKEYPGDLRNRVVGSRMIKDGLSPYYYKWKKGDGFRYYDPDNFDSLRPSIASSTPFLHQLLTPLAELPEARLSRFWLVIEYGMTAGMAIFAFLWAKTNEQRQAVVLLFLLFLLTNAWKLHIANGQTYLCIPFFAMLFFGFWRKNSSPVWAIAAGVAAACLVLIRPNTLLVFVPFLFILRNYRRSWLLAFLAPVVLLAGWTILSPRELGLWQDYTKMLDEQIRFHQGLPVARQDNEPDPRFAQWEGIDKPAADKLSETEPVKIYSENGNAFVLFKNIFHRQLPVPVLAATGMLLIAALILLFYFLQIRLGRQDLPRAAIFGFCLYMVSDLFSPVYRHQYYTVQWIFPLLIAATLYSARQKWIYALLLTALLLSCIHLPFIKMGNTIGEYLILAVLLAISLLPEGFPKQELTPASLS